MTDIFPKKITSDFTHTTSITQPGLYAIFITASCKGKGILGLQKEQNLRVEINDLQFREIPPEKNVQLFKIPPAWNGTELRGLSKTVVFIQYLPVGDCTVKFIPNPEATVIKVEYISLLDPRAIMFDLNNRAEDGNNRPWFTFALNNLPLFNISATVSTKWHYFDGDDVKLIIDNSIEQNSGSRKYHDWVWSAKPSLFSKPQQEEKEFVKNLPATTHYVELWADKTPTLHNVKIDLGDVVIKRVPSLQDPKWTGNFADDPDQILLARLILGEMEGQAKEAKLGAGFTVLNRLQKQKTNWGLTLPEIILKPYQYDAFVNPNTVNKVRDPLNNVTREEWQSCYKIALQVLSGNSTDPTFGATHFLSSYSGTDFPNWATNDKLTIKIGTTYFYDLES